MTSLVQRVLARAINRAVNGGRSASRIRWALVAAALGGLAGCTDRPPQVTELQAEASVLQPGVVCRVGKDGGPLLAERGIGGTGVSFGDQLADRGIGGTGIVGVVTGFASVCVDGLEVRFDSNVAVDIDGRPSRTDKLRVGQLVAIRAADPAGTSLPSFARSISVRTEVAGPIEAVEIGQNAIMVAGQRVSVTTSTWGANRFGLGDWTAVSGLRRADGTIVASRLDDAPAGRLFVRGATRRHDGALWIGGLRMLGSAVSSLQSGDFITASGTYQSGQMQVASVSPDMLASNPTTYFGGTVDQLVLQAFVTVDDNVVWLGDRLKLRLSPSLRQPRPMSGDAIVTLERQPDGGFLATGLRYTKYPAVTAEVASLSHAWHVAAVPLPVPPVPPAFPAPLPTEATPGAVSPVSAADGDPEQDARPADPGSAPLPDALLSERVSPPEATDGAQATPERASIPISCATCARDRHAGPARWTGRRASAIASAKSSHGIRATEAPVAVFSTSSAPAEHGSGR